MPTRQQPRERPSPPPPGHSGPRITGLEGLDDRDGARPPWPLVSVALAFAVGWLLFAWPWLSGRVTIPWDAKAHFLPQVQFLAASLARGESPFWTPNVFAGLPQIADPQSLMFSPPMLLLALVDPAPGLRSIDTAVLLVVLGAGIGALWLAREHGWHWGGALIAALGLAFGAAMAWRLQHFGQVMSLAYWPFAHVLLKRALERPSVLCGIGAGIVAAFIVLGRDQVGLLCLYLLAGCLVWHLATAARPARALRRSVPSLLAGGAVGLALVAIPILLTWVYAQQSNRPAIDYRGAGAGSLHPALVITALVPHLFGAAGAMAKYWGPPSFTWEGTGLFIAQNMGQLYIGAVPLLLLGMGTLRGVLWDREVRFFTLATLVAALYALGWYTPVFRVLYQLAPGVGLYRRPADAVFVLGALASLLAGYVAHRLLTWTLPEPTPAQRVIELGLLAGGFALALLIAAVLGRVQPATAPMLLAAGWIAAALAALWAAGWMRALRPAAAALGLAALTAIDLAANNGPNGASALPAPEIDMLQPATRNPTLALLKRYTMESRSATRRDRVELAGLGFHWPNAALTHGLEHTLGYNPVRLELYSSAVGAGDTVGLPDQRKFTPLLPSYRSLLADLLGLRFIASGVPIQEIDRQLRPGDLTLLARTPDGLIYENPRALPRVLLATRAERADFAAVLATGAWPAFDPTTTVLIEEDGDSRTRAPGEARILSYRNTEVVIEAESPDGGWVVLNDVWQSWWRAEIDGFPARLLRANVLFRAVAVPRGRHTVRLVFRPLTGAIDDLITRRRAEPNARSP
jgi:hypothetical protein